ncbi:BTB/POZ domain-containing protein KCTD19-like [Antedon mediterranea]|uniref:BTB/POZ domain-containing protein KCTD19-like n=1 Tax=Antedon mediterranea TaxID=105859 RepID=UPI003AF7FB7A
MESPSILSSATNELLNLNVGGHFYTTTRSTLTRYPNSMLGLMFSSDSSLPPARRDDNNRYYIDGDGPTFRHILNFLRRSKLILPHEFNDWDMLTAEADFYQIPELIQLIVERSKQVEVHSSATDELLNLNIGGHFYTTTRATLTRYPKSKLGLMFGGHLPTARQDDSNRYYIDRDGPTFRYILNFMRQSKLVFPHGFKDWDILIAEADFYQIPDLVKFVSEIRKANNKSLLEVQLVYTAASVEAKKVNYCWKVYGQPKFLDQLPSTVDFNGRKDLRILKKEDIECSDFNRSQLFDEISKIGFTLTNTVSTSSSNVNLGGYFDGKDRWIFMKDDM